MGVCVLYWCVSVLCLHVHYTHSMKKPDSYMYMAPAVYTMFRLLLLLVLAGV
jgi:hypothetical protein